MRRLKASKEHRLLQRDYDAVRERLRPIANGLIARIDPADLRHLATTLGIADGPDIAFANEAEAASIVDQLIHARTSARPSLVEQYLAEPHEGDELDQRIWAAMAEVRFTVFNILQVERNVGVLVKDLTYDQELFIMDRGLGKTVFDVPLASRLRPMGDYWITTGGTYPISTAVVDEMPQQFRRAINEATVESPLPRPVESQIAELVLKLSVRDGWAARSGLHEPGLP